MQTLLAARAEYRLVEKKKMLPFFETKLLKKIKHKVT